MNVRMHSYEHTHVSLPRREGTRTGGRPLRSTLLLRDFAPLNMTYPTDPADNVSTYFVRLL